MKNILKFIGILFLWFLGGILFESDTVFYNSLNKPWFAPKPIVFGIVWTILYILISISIFKTINNSTLEYKKSLLINYFSNQIFTFLFFSIKSPFLALIDTVIIFISSLFLYYETKNINNTFKLLIPYIIWNLFALILITTIFFMNI